MNRDYTDITGLEVEKAVEENKSASDAALSLNISIDELTFLCHHFGIQKYTEKTKVKICIGCKNVFVYKSSNQERCPNCYAEYRRSYLREKNRKWVKEKRDEQAG